MFWATIIFTEEWQTFSQCSKILWQITNLCFTINRALPLVQEIKVLLLLKTGNICQVLLFYSVSWMLSNCQYSLSHRACKWVLEFCLARQSLYWQFGVDSASELKAYFVSGGRESLFSLKGPHILTVTCPSSTRLLLPLLLKKNNPQEKTQQPWY